jgi:fructokinase
MAKTIIAIGELLWDVFPDHTVLGGAPFNFAYRLHSLGDHSMVVSALGKDEKGEKLFEAVEKIGVDSSLLQWDTHPTGTVNIFLDEHKNPDFYIVPEVAYDYMRMNDTIRRAVKTADCVCFSTLTQRNEVSRATVREIVELADGKTRFYDINLRKLCYTKETISWSLERSDIIKLNETEAVELAEMFGMPSQPVETFCDALFAKTPLRFVVVTLGPKGAFAASRSGERLYEPGYAVRLVDPCGSGDSFSAGFIHTLLAGGTLKDACALGNIMGAITAEQNGATQPISGHDIDDFTRTHTERIIENAIAVS